MKVGFGKVSLAVMLLALVPAACSKSETSTAATLPVPEITLSFAAGRALTPTRVAEIFPEFELSDPEVVPAPVIFGSGRVETMDLREPVIVRWMGNAWTFVELPQLNHTSWVYVGASFERNELWAILDSTPDSKGAGLYLFRSTDKGMTWKAFSGVRPPTLSAEFVGFTINARGVGQISVHQDDDTEATPRGLYSYASNDGGKTWSGPTFKPDDLVSADIPLNPTLESALEELTPEGAARGPARGPAGTPGGRTGTGTVRGRAGGG